MAITSVLAKGTTAAESSDIVIADGAGATFTLLGAGEVVLEAKNSDGEFRLLGTLSSESAVRHAFGPATVRVRRRLSLTQVGASVEMG